MAYAHHAKIETNQTEGWVFPQSLVGTCSLCPLCGGKEGAGMGMRRGFYHKESFTEELGAAGSNVLGECARSRQASE